MSPSIRPHAGTGSYNLNRLGAFCDAVTAIAITILVLGLEVPSAHEVPESELSEFLLASVYPVVGYTALQQTQGETND